MNPEISRCDVCGACLPDHEPGAHCPVCLITLAWGNTGSTSQQELGPRRFGNYELIELLGKGGMGVVYKARHSVLGRTVALKMLSPFASAFPNISDRLRLEAETAAVLSHPNIVTIYEAGSEDGQPYFTMEYIEGVNLATCLKPGGNQWNGLPYEDEPDLVVAHLVAQIATAVDYAHQHGILHRDLKPANIVLDRDGHPHLTDFGLAKVLYGPSTGTVSGEVMGTPTYMAPEVAAGGVKRATTASDVYSLGVILYEMLAGRPPFRGDTPMDVMRAVVEEDPPHPSLFNTKVDADLATICLKCMEKATHQRYASALALAEDLERWLRDEPIEARPVRVAEKIWRWCRREPGLAAMVACIILLVIVAGSLGALLYHNKVNELREKNLQTINQRNAIVVRIENDWKGKLRQDCKTIILHPAELAALTARQILGTEIPVSIGLEPSGSLQSSKLLDRIFALDRYVQTNMVFNSLRPSALGIHLYPTPWHMIDAMTNGTVDFVRADPANFLNARRTNPRIHALVTELDTGGSDERVAAVFVRNDSEVQSLHDLKGRSLALGPEETALGTYLPKAALVAAGIKSSDISSITNLQSTAAIHAVLRGSNAAGVAMLQDIKRFQEKEPLRILTELRSPGNVWVSTTNARSTAEVFKASLLRLRDESVMQVLDYTIGGFSTVNTDSLDRLDDQMRKAERFDARDDQ